MVYDNSMKDRLNFNKPNVFLDIHVPLLVFQANTLRRIHRDYTDEKIIHGFTTRPAKWLHLRKQDPNAILGRR